MTLLEGYIALWRKYPDDEVKVRVARPSRLAPSEGLLLAWKAGSIDWDEYTRRFREEILANPDAVAYLKILGKRAKTRDIRLMCYEKPPKPCHRFILIDMINEMEAGE